MKESHMVNFERYDSCRNGCRMYTDDGDDVMTSCPVCNAPRYVDPPSDGKSHTRVSVASISDIITSKLYYLRTRQQLMYRNDRMTEDICTKDIFDGSVYKTMKQDGFFSSPYDVAIGLSIDGFRPFDRDTIKATMVNMVIYNIDLKQRYKKINMVQLLLIFGTNKPRLLDSFLTPIIRKLDHLSRTGIKVATSDQGTILSKVHVLSFVGDIPAVADLIGHGTHAATHGCRMCLMEDLSGNGMHFPGQTYSSLMQTPTDEKTGGDQLRGRDVPYLHTFTGPHFFGLDEMHMIAYGLAKMVHDFALPLSKNNFVLAKDLHLHLIYPYPYPSADFI